MSDSIDRVFVKAITTIKALSSRSNYGSLPRPPADNRIKLYGLYKQATEGNVNGIMTRPTGYSMEDEGAKKKWDAWKREEGLSKTQAKRQYILYLIDTMKVYASGTLEARELLNELEYLWDQIKDLQFDSDDGDNHSYFQYALPSHSPLFSQAGQSDRFSTATPLPLASNYSASNVQYRNNLQKIYSHSRRSTMLSINDYVNQQRQQPKEQDASVFSLPAVPTGEKQHLVKLGHSILTMPPQPVVNDTTIEDFKNWQGEINLIVNKLSKEFLHNRTAKRGNPFHRFSKHSSSESESDESDLDQQARIRQRLIHIAKIVGTNAYKLLKNFAFSVLAILFLIWCAKKNVIVERTLVKQTPNKKKELVINMILNTDENKWFIRLLNVLNSFVGFV